MTSTLSSPAEGLFYQTASADHIREDLDTTLAAFATVGRKLRLV